jgi:hypothetical protein
MPRKTKKVHKHNRFDTIEVNGKSFRIAEVQDDEMNIIRVVIPLSRKQLSDNDRVSLYRKASNKGVNTILLQYNLITLSDYSGLGNYEKNQLHTA